LSIGGLEATYLRKDIVLNEVRFDGKVASAIGVVGAVCQLLLQSDDEEVNVVDRERYDMCDTGQQQVVHGSSEKEQEDRQYY
jgi:hypothetical protein